MTSASTGAPATATVGGYSIVPSGATGSGLSNYSISYVNGNLTVNPAPLTITANDASKTYGATASFASTAFTNSTLFNGDTVTAVTSASTGAPATATVGGYSIVPSGATGSGLGNYSISYVNGNLTVNPAALTITANDVGKAYGGKQSRPYGLLFGLRQRRNRIKSDDGTYGHHHGHQRLTRRHHLSHHRLRSA